MPLPTRHSVRASFFLFFYAPQSVGSDYLMEWNEVFRFGSTSKLMQHDMKEVQTMSLSLYAAKHQVEESALGKSRTRKVYVLPNRFIPDTGDPWDADRHLVDWNGGIDLRVDWSGDDDCAGTFEALCQSVWVSLQQVSPGPNNEMLVSQTSSVTNLRLSRGPDNPAVRFAAKLIPITWHIEPKLPDDHALVVERELHYTYAEGHGLDSVPWVPSTANQDGVHYLAIDSLVVGQDYEVWVRMWHPVDADKYKDMDPILRTGSGGGNAED